MKTNTSLNTIEAQCLGKQAFKSLSLAVGIAKRGSQSKDRAVSAYKCPHCKLFHVGQSVLKQSQAGLGRGMKVLEKHS